MEISPLPISHTLDGRRRGGRDFHITCFLAPEEA